MVTTASTISSSNHVLHWAACGSLSAPEPGVLSSLLLGGGGHSRTQGDDDDDGGTGHLGHVCRLLLHAGASTNQLEVSMEEEQQAMAQHHHLQFKPPVAVAAAVACCCFHDMHDTRCCAAPASSA